MKHLEPYELRELCIKNDWFTCGTIKQYEKLFDRNKEEALINELSIIIWVCSNNISKDEIYQKLLGAMMDKTLI